MDYTPLTEHQAQEIELERLLAKGEVDFEIIACDEKTSKSSGKQQLEFRLKCWDIKGKEGVVFAYTPLDSIKLRYVSESVGLLDIYERKELEPHMFINRTGKGTIDISPAQNGFKATNIFNNFIKPNMKIINKFKPQTEKADFDDDIGF